MSNPSRKPDDIWLVSQHFMIHNRDVLQRILKNTHNQLVVIMACDGDNFRLAYDHKPEALEALYQTVKEDGPYGSFIRNWINDNFRDGEPNNDKRRNQKADPEER